MHEVTVTPDRLFQALADSTRIRIVRILANTGEESCLCELTDSLLEPQYKISRHLKVLRQAGLLLAEKDGRWVYHRLVDGLPHFSMLYNLVCALPDTDGFFGGDLQRFRARMKLREDGRCRTGVVTKELAAQAG